MSNFDGNALAKDAYGQPPDLKNQQEKKNETQEHKEKGKMMWKTKFIQGIYNPKTRSENFLQSVMY